MEEKEQNNKQVEDQDVGTQANENKDEGKAFKTFQTEEDYNKAVNSIIKSKLPPKEEMDAFKEWKENQKTEQEKQAEKEAEYLKKDNRISDLEKENAVLKAGVREDIDYVLFKVGKMEGEFEENLKSFLIDNPKYLSSNKDNNEESNNDINLGGNHQNSGNTDLSKMSYEEYKAYRKNSK